MRCLQILSGHFLGLRWLHIGPGPNAYHTKSGLRIRMQYFGRILIAKRSGPVRSHPYTVLSSKVRHGSVSTRPGPWSTRPGSGSTPTGSATLVSLEERHKKVLITGELRIRVQIGRIRFFRIESPESAKKRTRKQ